MHRPAANRTVVTEFRVADVDAEYQRLTPREFVQKPTMMPWGNRSLLSGTPSAT
ncbi:hypothetical protein ACWDZ6_16000 [Streptomyces sp. NPDC002926]